MLFGYAHVCPRYGTWTQHGTFGDPWTSNIFTTTLIKGLDSGLYCTHQKAAFIILSAVSRYFSSIPQTMLNSPSSPHILIQTFSKPTLGTTHGSLEDYHHGSFSSDCTHFCLKLFLNSLVRNSRLEASLPLCLHYWRSPNRLNQIFLNPTNKKSCLLQSWAAWR